MKAALAALAACLVITASGCRGVSCTLPTLPFASDSSPSCGCASTMTAPVIDGDVGGCCGGTCSAGGCGGGMLGGGACEDGCCGGSCLGGGMGSGLMGCAGGGMCNGGCGMLGGCGGQLIAPLAALKARTARGCANGNCGLPPGPQTGAVNYPYYTTRGPRDFFMCNPPSIGP